MAEAYAVTALAVNGGFCRASAKRMLLQKGPKGLALAEMIRGTGTTTSRNIHLESIPNVQLDSTWYFRQNQ